jgi:hypothetical protein
MSAEALVFFKPGLADATRRRRSMDQPVARRLGQPLGTGIGQRAVGDPQVVLNHRQALTWQAGVDALSFGFVKNGAMSAEALVFFKPGLAVLGQGPDRSHLVGVVHPTIFGGVGDRDRVRLNPVALWRRGLPPRLAYPE